MSQNLTKFKKFYFVGIAGTGMATTAGLLKSAGYEVVGSDQGVFPPMSNLLDKLNIKVLTPYDPKNIEDYKDHLFVIGNALSRTQIEVQKILDADLAYTSFPQVLETFFLSERFSVVVCGTHGKTTTTSLLAHLLTELGEDPSFVVGGAPKNFGEGFHLGKGKTFVLEGDEYDTGFFDKKSKFLHYCPNLVVFNNMEFDHADIFKDLNAVREAFTDLFTKTREPHLVVANFEDKGVSDLMPSLPVSRNEVCTGKTHDLWLEESPNSKDPSRTYFTVKSSKWPTLNNLSGSTILLGNYNLSNIAQAMSACLLLAEKTVIKNFEATKLLDAVASFLGVARRLDFIGEAQHTLIYEDFAHHPTAVKLVLESLRKKHGDKKLIVAYEPKNATSRRSIFHKEYVEVFKKADAVYIGETRIDERIPMEQRLDPAKLATDIGPQAKFFNSNEALLEDLSLSLKGQEVVVFMSSLSFSGLPKKLFSKLSCH